MQWQAFFALGTGAPRLGAPCRPEPDAFQGLDPELFLRGGAIYY